MNKLKATWELFKVWRKARATVRSMKLFQRLVLDKSSGMEEIVRRNAMRMASAMVMNWQDAKRIVHCRFCHSTDQLRRHTDYMICPFHEEYLLKKQQAEGVVDFVPSKEKPTELQEA